METDMQSILVLGESDVGKTHYGAQLLKRLIVGGSALQMDVSHATNLEPFEVAMECLAEGRAAEHTPATTYVESVWPIEGVTGRRATLLWPDYGGEQVRRMMSERRIPSPWQTRVAGASDWLVLLRLHKLRRSEDIFSRPISSLGKTSEQGERHEVSDQARLIELLQMLLHVAGSCRDRQMRTPTLTVLLTCWDELGTDDLPTDVLRRLFPMLMAFIESCWAEPAIVGLSALGRPLNKERADGEYAGRGPESFGYVVLPDGRRLHDITWPVHRLFVPTSSRV